MGDKRMSDISQGISVTTHTETCCEYPQTSNIMHLYTGDEQDYSCINCYETKEGKSDKNAWDLHEDDRLGEGKALTYNQDDNPTASDWVSSETIVSEARRTAVFTERWSDDCKLIALAVEFVDKDDPWLLRREFTPPIVQLQDGGEYEELWELDDERQRARETECRWCHLLTPKQFNDCQACDKPLENNLI
jgi:hypothetical protein